MEFLTAISSLIGGGAAGGLIGLAGTWLRGREERETKRLDHAHAQAMRGLDLKELEREAELKLRQTDAEIAGAKAKATGELAIAQEVAAGQAQTASYDADRATYSSGWADKLKGAWGGAAAFMLASVDAMRGAVRPLLTVYLIGVLTLIAVYLYRLGAVQSVDAAVAWPLLARVVDDFAFLAATATTWWFGSRPNRTHK